MENSTRYLTVKQIAKEEGYPFTLGQLYSYLLERQENGLWKAVRKIGKRIFIRKDLFDEWIESFCSEDVCDENKIGE